MSNGTQSTRVRPWHIANTTVRNPLRLQGGLEALIAGGFERNMGKEREEDIALALDAAGVIHLSDSTTDITSIARKWRSALVKLGFLWPDPDSRPKIKGINPGDIGAPFALTPNGHRLLTAKSWEAVQEVLLRSLAALRLPSPLEPRYTFATFSPLKHVIRVLDQIALLGEEAYISRLEMASIVVLTSGEDSPEGIARQIVDQRSRRAKATGKKRFDSAEIRTIAEDYGLKYGTLYDYQDVSFRYMKGTGIFQSRGRGITLVPEKRKIAALLAESPDEPLTSGEYLNLIASGAELPTDTQEGASKALADLLAVAAEWSVEFDSSRYELDNPAGISLARHDLESEIFQAKEVHYADQQADQMDEILAYLRMLDENKATLDFGDEQLMIPKEERPAYFEWLLWRVLLALDHLTVPAREVRHFQVDQDFLPVSTAAGGGADVVGEYEDSVLVVEVTLTENSRQEAAEGEPVRRHVADALEQFASAGKDVYGLFLARRIDTNTAETFRMGVWYTKNDDRVALNIVPLTLRQLRSVLERGSQKRALDPSLLIDVIVEAAGHRRLVDGAPEWKQSIAAIAGG